jgi:hypothetical protein
MSILQGIIFPEKNGRYKWNFPALGISEGYVILHPEAKHSARTAADRYCKLNKGWKYSIVGHDQGWLFLRTA